MADINTVALTGRLVKDLAVPTKTKTSGLVKFTLAVNGYNQEDTSFVPCQAWGKICEYLCKYSSKGDMIAVTGQLKTYKTKDGNIGWVVNLTTAVNYKKQNPQAVAMEMAEEESFEDTGSNFYDDDDVPF